MTHLKAKDSRKDVPALVMLFSVFLAGAITALCLSYICNMRLPDRTKAVNHKVTVNPTLIAETPPVSTSTPAVVSTSWDSCILVNATHALPDDYPIHLKTLNNGRNSVDERIYADLQAMLSEGIQEGLSFYICSGYRSREKQEMLYNNKVSKLIENGMTMDDAKSMAVQFVQKPGHSEHETGLALDITSASYTALEVDQENTREIQWLQQHCSTYGFILRYPEDKVHITGVSYEPWHFRYVGKEAAVYMMEHNLTLEEYVQNYPS